MSEEWIVRVEGKEYGPVGTDELRQWRREGRLIPTNDLRRADDERWIQAGDLPEIFSDAEQVAPPPAPRDFERARTWRQIFAETLQIYRRGFVPFLCFGLLTSIPMFVLQWTFPKIPIPSLTSATPGAIAMPALPPISAAALVLVLLVWPVSVAGFQIVADDVLRGETRSIGGQVLAALRYWGRLFAAALLVYGSYFFWFFIPMAAMLSIVGGASQFLALPAILLIGGLMAYMNARLFVNFLFWQQTTVLGAHLPLVALRESKELARGAPEAPRLDRPLYRGAIVASVWLLLLFALTLGAQLPFMLVRFAGIENPEQAMVLMQEVAESKTPDALVVAADIVAAAINLLLRPLLAAAFVVLYYDARARSGRINDEEIRSE